MKIFAEFVRACPVFLILISSPSAAQTTTDPAQHAFEQAKELGTPAAWDAFLNAYPSGFLADLAKAYKEKIDSERSEPSAPDPLRAASTSPLTSGFTLPDLRGHASGDTAEKIAGAVATLQKVRENAEKRKIVCDMTDMKMDGDIADMIKEAAKRAKKLEAFMKQVGPGFSKAWLLKYNLTEGEKATSNFDEYIDVHNRILLSCPRQWLGTRQSRSFAGLYQTPGRTVQVKYDAKYWDENNEAEEPPHEPLHPGQEDIQFTLAHNSDDGSDLAEVKFRSAFRSPSPDEVRKKYSTARVSTVNGLEVLEMDFQDGDTKGLDFRFPDLALQLSARAPSKEFDAARAQFSAVVAGVSAGANKMTDAAFQEAASRIELSPPTSKNDIKSNDKFCSRTVGTLRGALLEDYDDREQHGYKVEVSEPCAVDYVIVPASPGCAKGSLFTASGVIKGGVGDDAEDVMNLKAAKIVCAPNS